MILIQSLIINYILLLSFYVIGSSSSKYFSFHNSLQKIIFGFCIFVIVNYFLYFVFFLQTSLIIIFWSVVILILVFLSPIFEINLKIKNFFKVTYLFLFPITFFYTLVLIIYGEQFYVFRGNHWDLFSYLSLASLFNEVSFKDIIDQDFPSHYLHFQNIESLSYSRPLTSFLLGLFLNIKSIDIFLSVSLFKIIFIIISSLSIYLFFFKLFKKKYPSYFLSISFTFSFWLIYIYEIEALSHIISLPIFLLLLSEMIKFNDNLKLKSNSYIIYFSILNSALFLVYPELFIISSVIIFSYILSEIINNKILFKKYFLFFLKFTFFFLLITSFAFKTNYLFLYQQVQMVITENKNWWGYFGSFILGKENLVLDKVFVDQLKLILTKNNFFEAINFLNKSHHQNNYNFYYLNIIPSLFGLYHISLGKILTLYNYFEIIVILLLQIYLIYKFFKNSLIIIKEKKILFPTLFLFTLCCFLLINNKIWSLIKLYSYISPLIFLFIVTEFNLKNSKISLKINKFVILLILTFPIYKYTSYNNGIGKLDSFPSVMHPNMKKNFDWSLKKESLKNCTYVYVYVNDYFKKSYLILKLLNYQINNNFIDNINLDLKNKCYLVDNQKYFDLF